LGHTLSIGTRRRNSWQHEHGTNGAYQIEIYPYISQFTDHDHVPIIIDCSQVKREAGGREPSDSECDKGSAESPERIRVGVQRFALATPLS
jgi:hypothetical protein